MIRHQDLYSAHNLRLRLSLSPLSLCSQTLSLSHNFVKFQLFSWFIPRYSNLFICHGSPRRNTHFKIRLKQSVTHPVNLQEECNSKQRQKLCQPITPASQRAVINPMNSCSIFRLMQYLARKLHYGYISWLECCDMLLTLQRRCGPCEHVSRLYCASCHRTTLPSLLYLLVFGILFVLWFMRHLHDPFSFSRSLFSF